MTTELPRLLRQRLRAQADLFATLTSHPVLIGTGREHALAELLRQFMPRRFEILAGAVAIIDENQRTVRSTHQLDMIIADTMDFPMLLRSGNVAVVVSQSVRGIVEVKSNLERGARFISALTQIAQTRQLLGSDPVFTALFSFGAPTQPETLRDWLSDMVALRNLLVTKRGNAPITKIRDALLRDEAIGLRDEESLLELLHNDNLPNVIAADRGAVARKGQKHGSRVFYTFLGGTSDVPSIMVLIDEFIEQLAAATTDIVREAMMVVRTHFSIDALPATALEDLELPSSPPLKAEMNMHVIRSDDREHFMTNRQPGIPVRVVRMPSVEVVRREGRLERVPAVDLTYSFIKSDEEWVFHEICLAAKDGLVDLRDTLWAELEREGGYRLMRRSGSF